MRADEEQARSAVDMLLSRFGERPSWAPGDEPPDYWLDVSGVRFAVEATQVHRQVRRGAFRGSELQVETELRYLLGEIAERAFADDLVRGYYRVRVAPIEGLRRAAPIIESRLRAFFGATRDVDRVQETRIWGRAWGARWGVQKIDGRDALIDPHVDTWGIAPFAGEIGRMLSYYVEERLHAKERALAKLPTCQWIMILIDAFFQPDDDQWVTALSGLDTSRWHTIARVGGSNPARIIHSRNPRWLRKSGRR